MPSGFLMASVRMTYPLGIESPYVRPNLSVLVFDLADGLLGAELDGLVGRRLQFRWDIRLYRHRIAVIGEAEHVRANRETHSVTATALVVYPDLHASVNSKCNSVRPRRMYVGTYW